MRKPHDKGFTESPYFCQILDPYRERGDQLRRFANLPASELRRLRDLLPLWNREQTQNASPTIDEFAALSDRFPGILYEGYTVCPERSDERLSIETIYLPESELNNDSIVEMAKLGADEIDWVEEDGKRYLRMWWD